MRTFNTTKSSVIDQASCEGQQFTFETVKIFIMVESTLIVC